MSREIELKYRFSEDRIPQLLSDPWLSAVFREILMESTYFDNAERALQNERITFRRRKENDTTVYTVKTHISAHERGEWEVAAEGTEDALCALSALGAPALPQGPYEIVAEAKFLRRAARITPSEGAELELSVDVGTLGPVPFCELEIELKRGTEEELAAFADEFLARYPLVPEPLSKFARARKYQSL